MLKLSLDNPFALAVAIVFFGLIGYILNIEEWTEFDALFSILMGVYLFFLIFIAEYVERKKFPSEISLNPLFCYFTIAAKLWFMVLVLRAGVVDSFDDRLSVFGNSFLLGFDNALTIFLFPLIPALTRRKDIFWLCVFVWTASSLVSLFYAPSKSFMVNLIFSLLFYRFLKRKVGGEGRGISILSFRSFAIACLVLGATFFLVYAKSGEEALGVLLHRAAYNYDSAIYVSGIYEVSRPEHGVFFYALLPLLKQFDPSLYDLQFYSVPQWVLYEALGIDRFGRFGYPNDNFVVGVLVSYGLLGIAIFFLSCVVWLLYLKISLGNKRNSAYFIYLVFQIPLFYSSLQDFSIYFLVVSVLYAIFSIIYFFYLGVLRVCRNETAFR